MGRSTQSVSFDELAREMSRPLLRYLQRFDPALADDLLQETLLRIAHGLAGFAGRSNVKTLAFSIAANAAADYFRGPERRLHAAEMAEASDLADGKRMIDEKMVLDEMNACVRQVIDSLPQEHRTPLVLHDLDGLTVEQTAEICNCPLPTAKIRIHRARYRLKTALQRRCNFYRDTDNVLQCDRKP